ncbi:hypothetical protein C2G38_2237985 [Gigaspora rosea]|uniref:Galactose oxidase n=1 Tax=Gigaspora rosea TaxID=44941 RepID=A0A397WAN9_9GLOM|nr:hypothetical protein C2G38_2237985 [Gigaspora rosea]
MSYTSFYIFAFLLNFIFAFANYVPSGRSEHTATLVNKKIYFHGGFTWPDGPSNDFFYLDVSQNFSTSALPWTDLTIPGSSRRAAATACKGGKNHDSIFIFGSFLPGTPFTSEFNTTNQEWTNVTSGGIARSSSISCASFNKSLIAIFAGANDDNANYLWILDSFALTWSFSNAPNTPQDIYDYCAVTLPDEKILYIGGQYANTELASMGLLSLYDTATNTWKNLSTSGPTPLSRVSFSAVLTSDKRIIIFAGTGYTDHSTVLDDLWILDIETYQWSVGNILNPNGLAIFSHTATLVDDYMIVAFGRLSYNGIPPNVSSTIYMLDVSQRDSYQWVTEFTAFKK